ncbi:lipid kinase, YegS/Rv2252/BmrU family [Flavobacterium gillisiae]|uniref:Lipid kinase, YegS/Rv2252/BmrU family n=1 Tax=Flavobacterium gillisiae TaxID=150146 RepID=A0A1H3XAM4_9FLAO|nr:diacylglycerol kinase family protein [Flavobacterium gillisiae]SDZ95734.1 lipid kinase, YegS/Rv2252/BmrU family [Flavobacterium gillisiae]
MKKNIILIVNPVAGGIDKSEIIEATSVFADKEGLNLVLYTTTAGDDTSKIKGLYDTFKPERVIVAGGDGTIKLVAEALEGVDVIFGIIPAGSANGLATDLNIPKRLEDNLPIAFHHTFMEMDMIVINGNKSLHLSDLGLNAELIKNYESSAIHGKWGYALQVFNTLVEKEEPFSATITANGQIFECVAQMIVIANSKKYGTGIVINPQGIMNDGKFELVLLKNLDLPIFAKIIAGNIPVESGDIEIISTDKANIKLNSAVSFQIDGEYCGRETELNVSISPKKFKVAIP